MPDYVPPENVHRPLIRKVMRPLAEAIQKESGASRVIITCTYELNRTAEKMTIRMQVSNDNSMERNDAKPPRPAGNKLAMDAEQGLRNVLDHQPNRTEGV